MEPNTLAVYMPNSLGTTLDALHQQLHNTALRNLDIALQGAAEDSYTEMEKRSIVAIEEMKMINGMDLAAVLLRGKIYKQIREEGLWSVHPEGFTRLVDIARFVGISISELSNIVDLCEVVFPYMSETLGVNVAQVWEEMGKSNFRELLPIMKTIITGEAPDRSSTREAANYLLNDVAATAQATGQDTDEETIRQAAVQRLIENGTHMTNRDLRAAIRPDRTPNINLISIHSGDTRLITAELSEDQWVMLSRIMNGHLDPIELTLPEEPMLRRSRAMQIPAFRRISSWVSD